MKRLIKRLAVAAVAGVILMAVAGCDLIGAGQKSGPSWLLQKHRFGVPDAPGAATDRTQGDTGDALTPDGIRLLP